MALNKSNTKTPNSRSGYFTELTASAGKQTNYLMPVRIKVTPKNSVAPLSDGKKNAAPKFKPVLVKDLLRSTEKGRHNATVTSVSTQKKKRNPSKVTESYLNTQSCYKPKNNEETSAFFNRKSLESSKVRRQLYQNLDSSQKVSFESSEITNNVRKTKNVAIKSLQSTMQGKIRKSFLLPPNSIKNSIIKKSENVKAPGKQIIRSSKNITGGKSTKSILTVAEPIKPTKNDEKSFYIYEDEADNIDLSSPEVDVNKREVVTVMQDNFTMTSPCLNRVSSKASKDTDTDTEPKIDFGNMTKINQNNLNQMKRFLEQSIQASEEQLSQLKQLLNFVNSLSSTVIQENSKINNFSKFDGEDEVSKVVVGNEDDSSETSAETITLNLSSLELKSDNNVCKKSLESEQSTKSYETLPIPMKILINADDVNQEAKELSLNQLDEMARLSTIGEVSCEVDLSEKIDSANKENRSDYLNGTYLASPKTPRTPRRRTIAMGSCESQGRRQSIRLAAKRMSLSSLSDSDSRQDSFTTLENELNVVHEKLPSKSVPATPTKTPLTPGFVKQWDKRVERPLKEYMALKMNSTLLVTPDAKKFQSKLASTDTPHSRKSLSKKVFLELCDLFAESPDSSK